MKQLLVGIVTVTALYAAITYFVSGMVLDTPRRTLEQSETIAEERWGLNLDSLLSLLPSPEEVTFSSPVDGITLSGWLFRREGARCGMVMAHGYHDNRVSLLKYTPYFDRCGCDLLLYDHRGFGNSDEAYATGGVHEARDLLAAHRFLRETTGLPDARIGWLGESWGAATALIAAGTGETAPAFVVAESPYADWETAITERGVKDFGAVLSLLTPGTFAWVGVRAGIDFDAASPLSAAAQIEVPTLLVHSLQDTLTAPAQSDRIAAAIRPDLLTYRPLDWGAWHAHNVVWDPEAFERMLDSFVLRASPGFCKD